MTCDLYLLWIIRFAVLHVIVQAGQILSQSSLSHWDEFFALMHLLYFHFASTWVLSLNTWSRICYFREVKNISVHISLVSNCMTSRSPMTLGCNSIRLRCFCCLLKIKILDLFEGAALGLGHGPPNQQYQQDSRGCVETEGQGGAQTSL